MQRSTLCTVIGLQNGKPDEKVKNYFIVLLWILVLLHYNTLQLLEQAIVPINPDAQGLNLAVFQTAHQCLFCTNFPVTDFFGFSTGTQLPHL